MLGSKFYQTRAVFGEWTWMRGLVGSQGSRMGPCMAGLLLSGTQRAGKGSWLPFYVLSGSMRRKSPRVKARHQCSSRAWHFPNCFPGHCPFCLLSQPHELEKQKYSPQFKRPSSSKLFLLELRSIATFSFFMLTVLFKQMYKKRVHC